MIPFSMLIPIRNGSNMNALLPVVASKESNQMIVKPLIPDTARTNSRDIATLLAKLIDKYFVSFSRLV